MNEKINIFFAVNDLYVKYLSVTMASILMNTKSEVSFFVISHDITDKSKKKLAQLKNIKNFDIEYIDIDSKKLDVIPESSRSDISVETNYRFLVSTLKPNMKKCIFLDVDLVVDKDIFELWNTNIEDYYMAAVTDRINFSQNKSWICQLPLPKGSMYVNTGVTLINLDLWRKNNIEQKIFECSQKYRDLLKFPDQDILNIVLTNKIKILENRYNADCNHNYFIEEERVKAFSNPIILHWVGKNKPWKYFFVKSAEIYYKYAKLSPYYEEIMNNVETDIPIIFASDNKYMKYFLVALKSLICNISKNYNYDIYVLDEDISDEYKQKTFSMQKDNVKISFVDIKPSLKNIDRNIFFTVGRFALSTYYRMFIPRLFKDFKRVLFIDCDTVILDDVAKLYQYDLNNKAIGAALDLGVKYYVCANEPKRINYFDNILKLKNKDNYFQAGVLILDIEKLSKLDVEENLLKILADVKSPMYFDQCILNKFFEGNVQIINQEWNVLWSMCDKINYENILPKDILSEYKKAYKHPKIIHFSSAIKPWFNIFHKKSIQFWKYAVQCPSFKELLSDLIFRETRKIRLTKIICFS